jgi:hypothetical protein
MPSFLHEGLIALVRDQPAFAADLLTQLLHVELPPFTEARLAETALNELVPVEYHADAVVLFGNGRPVFGTIVEAQLQRDERKRYTWPLYAVGARARHECPVVVVVVTPDAATARWAGEVFDLGGGNHWGAYVIGPDGIPIVVDVEQAVRQPHLAVLSAVAHGGGDPRTAAATAAAAALAVDRFPEEQRLLYSALIEAAMSDAARREFQMLPKTPDFFSEAQRRSFYRGKEEGKAEGKAEGRAEGKEEGRAKGKAEAKAEMLLRVLTQRGLAVSEARQRQILDCGDQATLDRWWDRALAITSIEQLFG